MKSEGPAVTLKITRNRKEYSIDLTLAIKDNSWPEDAEKWRTRHRNGIVFTALLFPKQKLPAEPSTIHRYIVNTDIVQLFNIQCTTCYIIFSASGLLSPM